MKIRNLDGDILATGISMESILKAETSSRVHPLHRKSFKRADLRSRVLEGAVICASNNRKSARRSDFMGADFSRSKLKGAQFSGLDLRGAKFNDCDLRDVSFVVCDLTGACFDDVDASAFTDEHKTGKSTWFMDCILDQVRADGADFQEAHIGVVSAARAVFRNCTFEDAGFNGDWDGATFLKCNLEDANPGTYVEGGEGARFGVNLLDCNTKDILLKGCPTTPTTLPEDYVETPDESWDGDGFEVEGVDDAFEMKSKAAASAGRAEMLARYQAIADKILAQDAAQQKAQRVFRDQHQSDRLRRVKAAVPKVAASPPLSGSFDPQPSSMSEREPTPAGEVRIRVTFNQPLASGYATVRDQGFTVDGGRITGAKRVDGRSDRWELTVQTVGDPSEISITSTDALRAKGGRVLASPISVTIKV